MSFSQGVSGLNVAAANLDVIGNNIANSGTVGFKSGSVQFSNVYAGSMAGLGTKVSGVFTDFTAGAVQRSARPLDVAIVDGNGFFRMTSTGGEIRYTRNGQFDVDKNGYITNAAGLRLTGFTVGETGALAGASPVALQVPTSAMEPRATTGIAAQFNVDARSAYPVVAPFDAQDSTSYNYSNSVTIFDSFGNSHELSAYFVKTAPNKWEIYATADGKPLATGGAFAPTPAFAPLDAVPGSGGTPIGSIGFDSSGKMITTRATSASTTPASALTKAKANEATALSAFNATTEGTAYTTAKATLDATTAGAKAIASEAAAVTAAATAAASGLAADATAATTAATTATTDRAAAAATAEGIAAAAALTPAMATSAGVALAAARTTTAAAQSAMTAATAALTTAKAAEATALTAFNASTTGAAYVTAKAALNATTLGAAAITAEAAAAAAVAAAAAAPTDTVLAADATTKTGLANTARAAAAATPEGIAAASALTTAMAAPTGVALATARTATATAQTALTGSATASTTAASDALDKAIADEASALKAFNASTEGMAAADAKAALNASPEGKAATAAALAATVAAKAAAAAPTDTALAAKAVAAALASATATAAAAATTLGEVARTTAATAKSSPTGLALASAMATTARAQSALTPTLDKLAFAGLRFPSGAAPMAFEMTLTGTTQFGATNEVRKMSPDGYASGQLTTLAISPDGTVSGKYSNQQTKLLGQIVLSSFGSPNGLQNMGENVWSETPKSGAPLTGTAGPGTTLGALLGGAVEGSNVDLTAELINLIIAQRTYQANTQTVKTQDQVVQALINMR